LEGRADEERAPDFFGNASRTCGASRRKACVARLHPDLARGAGFFFAIRDVLEKRRALIEVGAWCEPKAADDVITFGKRR
jgi:hypothetical protein